MKWYTLSIENWSYSINSSLFLLTLIYMILIEIFNILLIEFKRLVCQNGIDLLIDFFQVKIIIFHGSSNWFCNWISNWFCNWISWLIACCFLAFSLVFPCMVCCSKVAKIKQSLFKGSGNPCSKDEWQRWGKKFREVIHWPRAALPSPQQAWRLASWIWIVWQNFKKSEHRSKGPGWSSTIAERLDKSLTKCWHPYQSSQVSSAQSSVQQP